MVSGAVNWAHLNVEMMFSQIWMTVAYFILQMQKYKHIFLLNRTLSYALVFVPRSLIVVRFAGKGLENARCFRSQGGCRHSLPHMD